LLHTKGPGDEELGAGFAMASPMGIKVVRFTSDEIEIVTHWLLFAIDVALKDCSSRTHLSSPNPFSSEDSEEEKGS